MSWEESYRREQPCLCGKGKYIEIMKVYAIEEI